MSNTRIQINSIVQNQLPDFVRQEFPLVQEFLSEYYSSLENQSGTLDLIQNIDQYVKVDNLTNLIESTVLLQDVDYFSQSISVESTAGFPQRYGLILIDGEIITYKSKTNTTFEDCVRGFSGVTEYGSELTFQETNSETHTQGTIVTNLSVLFLKEFFRKLKIQITPGFEDREFYENLNERLFVKQSVDFYKSKGSDESFEILFRALYGKDVEVLKPRDYVIEPSTAEYRNLKFLVVEAIQGDPKKLENRTLYQDQVYNISKSQGTVVSVEPFLRDNKEYFLIGLDYYFDTNVQSVFSEFSIHPNTKCLSNISINSQYIDVDSTVGFPEQGDLIIALQNGTFLNVNYTSKNLNQFLGCTGITQNIQKEDFIRLNAFAYSYFGEDIISVRVTGILSNIKPFNSGNLYQKGDTIRIKSLGKKLLGNKGNDWFFNIPLTYDVQSIRLKDSSSAPIYQINFYDEHIFKVGDTARIISSNGQNYSATVVSYLNSNSIEVRVSSILNTTFSYKVEKQLLKTNITYSQNDLSIFNANVQNVYYSEAEDSIYVSSSSLPFYGNESVAPNDRSISFSGTFNDDFEIFCQNHGLYTGDSIVYYPSANSTLDLTSAIYFATKVTNNTFKISRSRNDIFNGRFISISGSASNDVFVFRNQTTESLKRKYIQPQNLLRKIRSPLTSVVKDSTPVGPIGIFANGVEVHSYKSNDFVYYGPIESVDVLSSSGNFDVINPPDINISDSVGSGASVYSSVNGNLLRIDVIDPGFDYLDEPQVSITGGNGSGAAAKVKLTSFEHRVLFNSASTLVDLSNDKIGFSSYHKFRDNESVVYDPQGQSAIGGLSTLSSYYVSVQDAFTIKLHKSFSDSVSGINTISLNSYGVGNHSFKSTSLKKKISSITVTNSGSNYQSKKTSCSSVGINTALNEITLKNHGYSSGEIIVYSYDGAPAAGLSQTSYYVTKVDNDTIKLSNVGLSSEEKNFFYRTKQYVDITSVGSGTHIFDYEPIVVNVIGNIGISTLTSQDFNAVVQPIFRGKVQSVFIKNGGSGYGSENILNFNRQPEFSANTAASAQVYPVINNGSITDVIITNFGSGYNSVPDLVVTGSGFGAKLIPIIRDGQLVSVIIENKGKGYTKNSTSIDVIPSGTKLKLNANIKSWRVNDVERLIGTKKISDDDSIIVNSSNETYELQYCHKYAPRSLRKYILSKKNANGETVYVPDLIVLNGIEQRSVSHSPIIGWAYDGNPIYGPYGYSNPSGSSTTKILTSGYSEVIKENRPSVSIYPSGFFVEDYEYTGSPDLDEHNGRFCVTPEFPKGVYAYFCTINDSSVDSNGVFINYRKPVFPYIIGDTYKSQIIVFNYQNSSNQNQVDLVEKGLLRNIKPYNFDSFNSSYTYFNKDKRNTNQLSNVKSVSSGKISSVGIITGGNNYKVNDLVTYKSSTDFSKVTSIKGKSVESISIATSEFSNVEFSLDGNKNSITGFTTIPHGYLNNDVVTISIPELIESSNIVVTSNILKLNAGIGSTSYTGIVTYFNVYGNLSINENDVYQIVDEQVKVLNVDKINSRIRVLRNYNNTVSGFSTFSVGIALTERSRKFQIDVGLQTSYQFNQNKEYYFNPFETVGLGTTAGTGVGTTLSFSNPGAGATQLFIPTKTLYIQSHGLKTNDELIYSSNGGNPISVSTDGVSSFVLGENSIVYCARVSDDLIGISTVNIGLGTNGSFVGLGTTNSTKSTLYFTGIGTGVIHSFTTNYDDILTGSVYKNTVTVSTAETHGLSLNDVVDISLVSFASTTLHVKYDDYNRVLVVNERSFISSQVDTTLDKIAIENHGYKTGDKILYKSNSPVGGLSNQKIYYAIVVNKDEIKLANTYYSATKKFPDYITLTSTGTGSFSQVNPQINLVSNESVVFDLSDSSLSFTNNSQRYSAFDFDFYFDPSFKNKFELYEDFADREVVKFGQIGISTNAYVSLNLKNNTPKQLYYKLSPINLDIAPETKKQIIEDNEVLGNNFISVVNSSYSGTFNLVGVGLTTFQYNVRENILTNHDKTNSRIDYNTSSDTASGPINQVKSVFSGIDYYDSKSISGVSTITTEFGSGADLELRSADIGNITSIGIIDFGFDYPSDLTLSPTAKLPDLLSINAFYSLGKIGISSVGKNYSLAPDLILKGSNESIISDVDLTYSLGDTEVTILTNTKGIDGVIPSIIPVNNTNGIPINSISFNNNSKDVVVTLGSSFSSINDFPFAIGEKVLIENVSVGVGTTAKGYNSSSYNYSLFTIVNIDPNIGGIGATISYNLSEYLGQNEYPGNYDSINSSGQVVPQRHFPIFNIELKSNDFYVGEQVVSKNYFGTVEEWNSNKGLLKVSSSDDFIIGSQIKGLTSKTVGIVTTARFNPDLTYDVSSFNIRNDGWKTNKGFLNDETQRVHDSDYYQYFSYSLKSEVQYNTWENAVSSLNHTAGFKKFSDLQVTSKTEDFSGISTNQNNGDFVGIADISSVVDLNCVYDFDLARENNIIIDGNTKSNEVIFNSRILQDYTESIGNRVLNIDDFSDEFNSNPRSTRFSVVNTFNLDRTYNKFVTFVQDKIFTNERQVLLVSLLQDKSFGFLNQYGRVESELDLGTFDFSISGSEGQLLFYPRKSSINDYDVNVLSFSIEDTILGIGNQNLGDSVYVGSSTTTLPASTSSPITVVGIASTYRSSKVLVQISSTDNSYYEMDEITILHDGTNVDFEEYGQLNTPSLLTSSTAGLGTYHVYYSGSNINLDFIPDVSTVVEYNINTLQISLSDNPTSTGSYIFNNSKIQSNYVAISSSSTPGITTISTYSSDYDGAYYVVSVKDATNNEYQVSEVIVLDDDTNCYISEFGVVNTGDSLGSIGATVTGGGVELYFTPNANIDTEIVVFTGSIGPTNDSISTTELDFNNASINSGSGSYTGAESDVRRSFNLTHKQRPIFERYFDGSDSSIVGLGLTSTIKIPENFFVTGEKVTYSYSGAGTTSAIGIATTSISGIGLTDKLPSTLYIVKENELYVKVAVSTADALAVPPNTVEITSVGIGTSHRFLSMNQNSKVLLSIDNVIQSPVVSTAITSSLTSFIDRSTVRFDFTGITSFFGGDLIKIDDEIMRINSIGLGTNPNTVTVRRPWLGTGIATHAKDSIITKISGNYNIVENTLHFAAAPYGLTPIGTTTNRPDERDFVGVETHSTFSGRTFIRSGVPNTDSEPYSKNYIFDGLSDEFDGQKNQFRLTSNKSNISGFSTNNAIVLVNSIFQGPERSGAISIIGDYDLTETSGITSITFTGAAASTSYDVNTSTIPRGGIIVSVGSTAGFGYQPLVAAGGTAVVSVGGTISSISIGNSGSGYRVGIQTIVNVGVVTSDTGIPNIEFIGTAAISGGHIVSVAITNPGAGYTSSNPPIVVFDSPLSYSDIPLVYSSSSSGLGTGAVANIVVGQGSSVISFEITNTGYGYGQGEILTVNVGGSTGIPTDTSVSFNEFQIIVDRTGNDEFNGWVIGDLQVFDVIDNLFDGNRVTFPLKVDGNQTTIRSKKGSNIDVEATLLIFLNDVLQVPGQGYSFNGGSVITFAEPPKEGDRCKIIFYRGTSEVDTVNVDILETIKVGDTVTLNDDNIRFKEDSRLVNEIVSTDTVKTNVYTSPGVSNDPNYYRPVIWCKQTEDKIINDQQVAKDRILYEPLINPTSNLIENVGASSTVIYVESVKTFFDSSDEYFQNGTSEKPQRKVKLISQDTLVAAAATAIVSTAGTISSLVFSNSGFGYTFTNPPTVTIESPIGIGTSQRATANCIVSIAGTVSSVTITNPGSGYTSTNPPVVLFESPSVKTEVIENVSYTGDFGVVVGYGISTISGSDKNIFDLYIPQNSFLRDTEVVGTAITVSQLQVGDFFIIQNSNVGSANTNFFTYRNNGSIIGLSTQYVDGIYQVNAVETQYKNITGIGTTVIKRIFAVVETTTGISTVGLGSSTIFFDSTYYTWDYLGITTYSGGSITTSRYIGEFSWGKIYNLTRPDPQEFKSYGFAGIDTSSSVIRVNPLKYEDYVN
jgi:hypothetical protein